MIEIDIDIYVYEMKETILYDVYHPRTKFLSKKMWYLDLAYIRIECILHIQHGYTKT